MQMIYDDMHREDAVNKLAQLYPSVKVRDMDKDVPSEGFFIGSIGMSRWLKENRPNVKNWASFEKYLCSRYYPEMGDLLFNERYCFIPFKELARRKWSLYSWLGKEAMLFIRPDSGEKDTPAQLVDMQDIDKYVESYDYDGMSVVSTPKDSIGEWRFVVSVKEKPRIEAVSLYRFQGLDTKVPSAPQGAYELVEKVLERKYFPDEIFCVDVVQDMGGDFYVMELTSFSSAGLYACDPQKLKTCIDRFL